MTTNVEQCLNCPIPIATKNHGLRAQLDQEVVARLGNAAGMPGAEPVTQQHALQVALEYQRVGVKGAGQGMSRLQLSAGTSQGAVDLRRCLLGIATEAHARVHFGRLQGYMII
jgi:hypothetical protein